MARDDKKIKVLNLVLPALKWRLQKCVKGILRRIKYVGGGQGVHRNFKNVHQDVTLLAEFGLIELKKSGAGRAAVPTALFSEIVLAA